jgi:3-hydroxy acid dehydrogenase / malonic semialdehyde reductase
VTHISPGLVGHTEFSNVRLGDDSKASAVYDNIEALHPDDVADNVFYAVRALCCDVFECYNHSILC